MSAVLWGVGFLALFAWATTLCAINRTVRQQPPKGSVSPGWRPRKPVRPLIRVCEWCGGDVTGTKCPSCGAPMDWRKTWDGK